MNGPRCDVHGDEVPEGVPFTVEVDDEGLRWVTCRDCAPPPRACRVVVRDIADGTSTCGWCGTTPPAGTPWETVTVATTISRACTTCWLALLPTTTPECP